MKIYILMMDERVERVSCDAKKIRQLCYESNGWDEMGHELTGPYFVVEMVVEDIPKEAHLANMESMLP